MQGQSGGLSNTLVTEAYILRKRTGERFESYMIAGRGARWYKDNRQREGEESRKQHEEVGGRVK